MKFSAVTEFGESLRGLAAGKDNYIPELVSLLLQEARRFEASDIHLVPTESGLQMQWRMDGVLQTIAIFDQESAPRIIARLKVISGLLTYRTDLPQEGRVAREFSQSEIRVTTFPSLYGEKAAVRLFAGNHDLQNLSDLGLPEDIGCELSEQLSATNGVILLTGPSGSGKTTTAYACLRHIVAASHGERSVMTLEDPIEVSVKGVTQSQVRAGIGFDLASGLKSLMRQDPDVIMVGEIRDPATAEVAFQAALTGHLVITTYHAGSAIEAVTRLLDMQIEPYLLRSTLRCIICQRLIRKLQQSISKAESAESLRNGVPSEDLKNNSDNFQHSGCLLPEENVIYQGRMALAELLNPDQPEIARAILQRSDSRELATVARSCGFRTLYDAAETAVREGLTTEAEVFRVLGRSR